MIKVSHYTQSIVNIRTAINTPANYESVFEAYGNLDLKQQSGLVTFGRGVAVRWNNRTRRHRATDAENAKPLSEIKVSYLKNQSNDIWLRELLSKSPRRPPPTSLVKLKVSTPTSNAKINKLQLKNKSRTMVP